MLPSRIEMVSTTLTTPMVQFGFKREVERSASLLDWTLGSDPETASPKDTRDAPTSSGNISPLTYILMIYNAEQKL